MMTHLNLRAKTYNKYKILSVDWSSLTCCYFKITQNFIQAVHHVTITYFVS